MFIISKKFPLHNDGCGEFIGSWLKRRRKKHTHTQYGVTSNVRSSLERMNKEHRDNNDYNTTKPLQIQRVEQASSSEKRQITDERKKDKTHNAAFVFFFALLFIFVFK